ncbi:MAG: hypothetical protein WKF58_11720 [Ilumatobacteraceae bacterium]
MRDGVGTSAERPDGTLKVTGQFAYSIGHAPRQCAVGHDVAQPAPRARITGIDTTAAAALDGVHAVLTHRDVPGSPTYGMKVADQPVLAGTAVRYRGEPVAIVAAEHPEIARRALELIRVDYEPLEPITGAEAALAGMAASSTTIAPTTSCGTFKSATVATSTTSAPMPT